MGEEAGSPSGLSLAKLSGSLFLFSNKKEQGSIGMEGDGPRDQPEEVHKCEQCEKVFRSAKALGGHMRVHGTAERRSGLGEGRAAVSGSGVSRRSRRGEEDRVTVTCEICSRSFPSKKSLYGHMRLHPEREWRGMRAPSVSPRALVSYSSSSSSEVGDDGPVNCSHTSITGPAREQPQVIHLYKYFPRWSVTGKRGKPAAVTSSCSSVQDYLGPKLEDPSVPSSTLVHFDLADPTSYSLPKPETGLSPQLIDFLGASCAPGRESKELSSPHNANAEHALGEEPQCYLDDIEKKSKKQRRVIESEAALVHDNPGLDNQDPAIRYVCCNKIFTSHQAYGGHVSSHNKVKGGSAGHHQRDRHPNHELGLDNSHVCEICTKRFPSGQALGGHMGAHNHKPAAEAHTAAACQQKVLNIDLNEAPPAEED